MPMKPNRTPTATLCAGVILSAWCFACPLTQAQDSISGVGISLGVDKETSAIKIIETIRGGPAAKAGLTGGLFIDQVNGISLKDKSLKDCVALMRGDIGTKVTLHVVDPAAQTTNKVELT